MAFSFIHSADLHLDSPLRGLSAYEEAPLERIRGASRQAFSALVDQAISRGVAFMVLAGDTWDGDWPDVGTGLYYASEMGRLERAGIRVFMLRGNHDAESRITRSLTLPENVAVFGSHEAETIVLDDLEIALHGQSFPRPDVTENIAIDYPNALPGHFNIGVLHTALEGDADHASYAPCRLSDLQAKGYDYWALGHVHRVQVLTGDSDADGCTIVYPGVLQGRHVRETGAKGAFLVSVEDGRIELERLVVDVVRWHDLKVDVTACEDFNDIARVIGEAIRDLAENADRRVQECLLATRITLTGETGFHGRLNSDREQLRAEALGQIVAIAPDDIFLEKIKISTTPALSPADLEQRQDALAELQDILAEVPEDGEFLENLAGEMRDTWNLLPPEVRDSLETSEPGRMRAIAGGQLAELVPELAITLLDQLANE